MLKCGSESSGTGDGPHRVASGVSKRPQSVDWGFQDRVAFLLLHPLVL